MICTNISMNIQKNQFFLEKDVVNNKYGKKYI